MASEWEAFTAGHYVSGPLKTLSISVVRETGRGSDRTDISVSHQNWAFLRRSGGLGSFGPVETPLSTLEGEKTPLLTG